jgi:hypothetical protein
LFYHPELVLSALLAVAGKVSGRQDLIVRLPPEVMAKYQQLLDDISTVFDERCKMERRAAMTISRHLLWFFLFAVLQLLLFVCIRRVSVSGGGLFQSCLHGFSRMNEQG